MKTNTFLPFVLKRLLRFIGTMIIVALMMPVVAFSQTVYDNPAAVDLLTAGNFRILAGTTVTINTGTTVTGDVGVSPGNTVTNNGTVNGNILLNDVTATQAQLDLTAAYDNAAGRTVNETVATELGGTTLGRGVYTAASGTFGITGTLTLTGTASDIFIFKMATTLTTGASSSVALTGGALASNVFWQVGSSATIDGAFKGIILSSEAITQSTGTSSVDGRLLARSTFVTVGGTSVLPVELTSFTAALINGAVELNWHTATEVNNYGFEVQRSETQNYNWTKIGFVNGSGNSNSPKEYSFTDKTISYGSYAYRLKQLDNDGAHTYSDVIEVNAAQILNGFLLNQNYPNPFNPSTQIQFGVNKNTHATLTVFNVLGVKVSTLFNGNAAAGQVYNVTFNGDNLASGIYYYKLQTNEKNEVRKMILMR
jgi:hypothetical protein